MKGRGIRLALAAAFAMALAADAGDMLILQCGSDWCLSGEDVRRTFESGEFRRALGPGWEFAVYDEMEKPTPDVEAANAKLAKLRVESKRFPAITCLTGGGRRFYAQIESIPFDVSPQTLAAQIKDAAKAKAKAEALFAKAKSARKEADEADALGGAFAILAEQAGWFSGKDLREGPVAWRDEWKRLSALDKDDKYGWRLRLVDRADFDLVQKASKFRTDGDFEGGEKFIASLRAIPGGALTDGLRQCIDIAEYALWRKDESRAESNKALLRHALSLGRDTIWGQCALGYLILAGEKIETHAPEHSAPRSRPEPDGTAKPAAFPLPKVEERIAAIDPAKPFDDGDRRALAQYAVLRRVGREAWDELGARPGSGKFARRFFDDREWMEDFAWSGDGADGKALLALESLFFQDAGRWMKEDAGRRFATAAALEHADRDEAWLADFIDAYRATAEAKRLHARALEQPVWQWRLAVQKGADRDDAPNQQRYLDDYAFMPVSRFGCACWLVPWRQHNCFGESVHGKIYYEPWKDAGEWIKRRYSPLVGGVCGELSTFGSACNQSHGLPSAPIGQPGHCAYTRRLLDGTWFIDYNINPPSQFPSSILPTGHVWSFWQAHEGTFEGDREKRLDADRFLELAHFAEGRGAKPEEIDALYRRARDAWPSHWNAWRRRGEWISSAKRPLSEQRAFADECAATLTNYRQPLWDLLTPFFERVAAESGKDALADEIVRLLPALRQPECKIQEEARFEKILEKWMKPLEGDAALRERVLFAALDAQYGTPDFFPQTLAWCSGFMMEDDARFRRFADTLAGHPGTGAAQEGHAKTGFETLILKASRTDNLPAFRAAASLQEKIAPRKREGRRWPENAFGGRLLSAEGMLKTSSTSRWDHPEMYPLALDALPNRENAFHTDKEKEPWGMVVLAGASRIKGVVVVNETPSAGFRNRQPPIEVQVSEDGKEWTTVLSDEKNRDEYRADLSRDDVKAKFVRVRRRPGAKDEVFHLNKILVYGDKLY